jgi:mono/diheme cytochrome c family protein
VRQRIGLAALAAVALVVVVVVVIATRFSDGAVEPDIRREAPVEPPVAPALPPPTGDPLAGMTVFAEAGCGNCHVLAAAGSTGTIGPVLDGRSADYARVLEQVTDGGGGMPASAGVLTDVQIQDVVAFTLESIERGG